jgi:uncharacterized membrane-anchored protein YitT (DUF2179 family)
MYSEWAIGFFLILVLWPIVLLGFTKLGRRFSTRTLLIGMSVIALALGAIVYTMRN